MPPRALGHVAVPVTQAAEGLWLPANGPHRARRRAGVSAHASRQGTAADLRATFARRVRGTPRKRPICRPWPTHEDHGAPPPKAQAQMQVSLRSHPGSDPQGHLVGGLLTCAGSHLRQEPAFCSRLTAAWPRPPAPRPKESVPCLPRDRLPPRPHAAWPTPPQPLLARGYHTLHALALRIHSLGGSPSPPLPGEVTLPEPSPEPRTKQRQTTCSRGKEGRTRDMRLPRLQETMCF